MHPLSPVYTALLSCLIFVPAYAASSLSFTETSLRSIHTSSSSPNAIFNYHVPGLTISLEFDPLPGRSSRSIEPIRWNSLAINARNGAIARSRGQGGQRAAVSFPFEINSFGIYLGVTPQLSQGSFTYSEMEQIISALRTVGRNINYHEFSCKIFRTNRSGVRINQIGTMTVEETGPSSGQSGELGAIEGALEEN